MATGPSIHELEPGHLPPGTQVGPWRVLELRGRGSYGAVYRVERVGEEEAGCFALKLALHPWDPRFEREVTLLSRLQHPNVPRLRGRGEWAHSSGPFPYLLMEWVEGVPLYDWAQGRKLSSRQVMRVLAQVARALAATHAAEGVHRDVKGENVLVRPEDARAWLIDFGACDLRGARTLTHEVLPPGTPEHRSPEALRYQWHHWRERGAHYEPSAADDVYALGVTAYRLVTGMYPPPGVEVEPSREGLRLFHPRLVPPEERVMVCPELAGLIRQMLSEEPSARGRAAEVAEALEQAAKTAGVSADQLITQRLIPAAVVHKSRRRPARPASAWRLWLAAAVGMASSVAAQALWAVRWQPMEPPETGVSWQERERSAEDAGTAGLLEEALVASARPEEPEPGWKGLGLEVPKEPLPGQARPPCKRGEVEINEGCWIRPQDPKPPCGERGFEWRGTCYYPVLAPPRPTTSEPRGPGDAQ